LHRKTILVPDVDVERSLITQWYWVAWAQIVAICSTWNFPQLQRTSLRHFLTLDMINHKSKENSSQDGHVMFNPPQSRCFFLRHNIKHRTNYVPWPKKRLHKAKWRGNSQRQRSKHTIQVCGKISAQVAQALSISLPR